MDPGSEFRLFCLTLRRLLSSDDIREVRALAGAVRHWDFIVRGAWRHRVESVVLTSLQRCDPLPIPPRVVAKLHQLSREATRRSLAQVAEVRRLGQAFDKSGIRVLVLKGVALSGQLYGEPGRRITRDIDLLVHPDQFLLAHKVMLET